jgi:hypothetical protein
MKMKKVLDPYVDDFFNESLLSYFEILKEELKKNSSSNAIEDVLIRYTGFHKVKLEGVIEIRDNFMKYEENKELIKSIEKGNIISAFHAYFGSNYISLIDSIIQSAITLFLKYLWIFLKMLENYL